MFFGLGMIPVGILYHHKVSDEYLLMFTSTYLNVACYSYARFQNLLGTTAFLLVSLLQNAIASIFFYQKFHVVLFICWVFSVLAAASELSDHYVEMRNQTDALRREIQEKEMEKKLKDQEDIWEARKIIENKSKDNDDDVVSSIFGRSQNPAQQKQLTYK